MPPRSNDFQKLILEIERQLAPTGSTVEESAMIPDNHDGTLREVDILVRVPMEDRELSIGIECRDHRRRADVPWIEQMKGKYDLLPIDRRIAVSRRGFSPAALRKARLCNIQTLSLDAAERANWSKLFAHVDGLTIGYDSFTVATEVKMTFPAASGVDAITIPDASAVPLGATGHSIHSWLQTNIQRPELIEPMREKVTNRSSRLWVKMTPPAGVMTAQTNGETLPIESLIVELIRTEREASLELTKAVYRKTAIATGKGQVGDYPVSVLITETEGKPVTVKVLFEGESQGLVGILEGPGEIKLRPERD